MKLTLSLSLSLLGTHMRAQKEDTSKGTPGQITVGLEGKAVGSDLRSQFQSLVQVTSGVKNLALGF